MARNAWRVLGISMAIAGGVALADKPAELPVRTEVQGRSTPTVTEEHFQAEKIPPPRLLPGQIRDSNPSEETLPVAKDSGTTAVGLQLPGECSYLIDLDFPIRGYFSSGRELRPNPAFARLGSGWDARAALDIAEMHFRSNDAAEARLWYHEVVKLAPNSDYATMAKERLDQTDVIPAGAVESREPPLADAIPTESVVRIR